MSVIERPPRVITCGGCGTSFEASPYGPAPDRCRDCKAASEVTRGRADRVRRSALEGRRPRGPYRDGITRAANPQDIVVGLNSSQLLRRTTYDDAVNHQDIGAAVREHFNGSLRMDEYDRELSPRRLPSQRTPRGRHIKGKFGNPG